MTNINNILQNFGQYDAKAIESGIYQNWEDAGHFAPDFSKKHSFCIALPPPNVTGSLHMGHGFNNTIMDALVRHARMQGKNTLWQAGTDHAGIATQMVVERQLATQNISRHELGREKFLDKVWQWKNTSGGNITRQIRRLGSSVDWTRERFTMDDGLSAAVQEVFVRLYDEGLIYRGKRLVNWDVKLETALSDLEVENFDEKGHLWYFRYYFEDKNLTADGKNYVVVATTRPETLLGDVAVAVHPNDVRFAHLIGQYVILPLTNRRVPIVADEYVDKDFGTGCVKITPAHDFNDYELGDRHNLPLINIFDKNARILPALECFEDTAQKDATFLDTPAEYIALDRFSARKKLVAQAKDNGWLEKIEDYALKAPRGDRSGEIVEPYLTNQWYVAIDALAKPAIEAVEDGRIQFVPAQYKNMYMSWMSDIKDWCISRQLWWGHRIPAFYDDAGNVYVAKSEALVRQKYDLSEDIALRQDEDVLDTWFSSGLWTFSTLGWTGDAKVDAQNPFLNTFHPTDVLVTGFDIIFFWVARMIMLTMHFVKDESGAPQIPFKTVYVHGLVRDGQGQKMSKSKGNVLDPIDLIDGISLDALIKKRTSGLMNPKMADEIATATKKEYPDGLPSFGTDALRMTFASLASTGRDINFDLNRMTGMRNFCNKIYNSARFVLMQCVDKNGESVHIDTSANAKLWGLSERWIMARLNETVRDVNAHFANYRLDLAASALYEFIWNTYCDWYLELSKSMLAHADSSVRAQILYVLLSVLETALRLLHPIMPFLTESLWQIIAPLVDKKDVDSIMMASYPVADMALIDDEALKDMNYLQALITAVRAIRGEMKLGNAVQIPVLLQNVKDKAAILRVSDAFCALAKVESLQFLDDAQTPPLSSSSMIGKTRVLVPMKGLIDPQAELTRLQKSKEKLQKQIDGAQAKLTNSAFVDKAPAHLVAKERAKLDELLLQAQKIADSMDALEDL